MNQRGIWIYCALVSARRRDERGATAVEYALIAGACVLVLVLGVTALRGGLGGLFGGMQGQADDWVP